MLGVQISEERWQRVECSSENECPREASGPGVRKSKDDVTQIHGCLLRVRHSSKWFRCILSFSSDCSPARFGCYYYSHGTDERKKEKRKPEVQRQEGNKWEA